MKVRKIIKKALQQMVCFGLSIIVIAPFYLVLVNSFKTKSEAARLNLSLPTEWIFSNYIEVIEKGKLLRGFTNSIAYASVSTTVGVLICAMAAFVLARNKTAINSFIYYFILCGMFFPVNFVTLLKVFQWFGIDNTRGGIIIKFTAAMIPFCVFTIRNFVLSVPIEMDEAAIIDGASSGDLFFKIIMPLMKPVMVTCFILQFMGVWSDFLTPLYLSGSSKLFPMTLAVYQFFGKNSSYWNYIFADIILTCIPVIVVYMLGQRYIVSGMTSGAVKS